ncbi:MAG: hypothetical protein WCH99_19935 [Verrucomicrobiota bacterium]
MNTIDEQTDQAEPKTTQQVRQRVTGLNTQELGKPVNIESIPVKVLVTLLAKEEAAKVSNGKARKEFHRRFRRRFNALAKDVKKFRSGPIRKIYIDESFKDFYAQAGMFTWPAELEPEKAILGWLFDSFIKRVALVSLVGLIGKFKHDRDLAEKAQRELHRRFYPEIKERVKNWESLGPRCNLDDSISETVKRFNEDGRFKWPAGRGPHKVVANSLLDTLIKIAPLGSLLFLMKKPETDNPMAQKAHTEFHRRFFFRIQALWWKWECLGPRYDVEFYTNKTFDRFFKKELGKFKVAVKSKTIDKDVIKKLAATFTNQAKDNREEHKKSESEGKAIHRLFGVVVDEAVCRNHKSKKIQVKGNTKGPSKRNLKMMDAMKRLREIHKLRLRNNPISKFQDSLNADNLTILRNSMAHYSPYTGRCEMPETLQRKLCRNLKISEKTLIERRSRLMAKLINFTNSLAPSQKLKEEEQAKRAKYALAREEFLKQGRREEQKPIQIKPHPKAIDPEVLRKYAPRGPW